MQVLLFILWVTSVGLHFPIDRFFLTLGLALRDSKVIIYGIDEKQGTAQVIPYEYDCESDAYIQNEHLSYTRQDSFFREATKEAVYRKMQSDRSNP